MTPVVAVVVSTIGRREEFRRLVESLQASSLAAEIELVVVDQSDDQRCAAVLRDGEWALQWQATTSARGASIGRNAGLRLTTAPLVAFPDDDAWYPPNTLQDVAAAFDALPDVGALCGRQITADGRASMLRWKTTPCDVTPYNFLPHQHHEHDVLPPGLARQSGRVRREHGGRISGLVRRLRGV